MESLFLDYTNPFAVSEKRIHTFLGNDTRIFDAGNPPMYNANSLLGSFAFASL